jgi:2',3'-cyclic-nucleotide 2'-phosphodiesterase (5'-nucleotidase family)
MQALTDTVRGFTKADAALLNAGLILEDLPSGPVTYRDIHRICPHPINPVVVHLRGDELIEVVRASLKQEFMDIPLRGFGFRGEVIGRMLFSGLSIATTGPKNGTESVESVTFSDGSAVEKQKTYRIATADTFTFGRLLPEIAKSEWKQYFLPEFLRDLLLDTLRKTGTAIPASEE